MTSWINKNLDCGSVISQRVIGGSDWSNCQLFETSSGRKLFVKTGLGAELFAGEALGLQAMHGNFYLTSKYFTSRSKYNPIRMSNLSLAEVPCMQRQILSKFLK